MSKHISGEAFKAKLLARREQSIAREVPDDAWIHALRSDESRELLSIIGNKKPQSIGDLSDAAGRAQPNVSRSLSAFVRAGLVEVNNKGRTSIPSLTDFGHQKAVELGLLHIASGAEAIRSSESNVADQASPYLFVSYPSGGAYEDGKLCLNVPNGKAPTGVATEDLQATVVRLIDHWWRIFYRRDAPYKVGAFAIDEANEWTLLFRSKGPRIERILRPHPTSTQSFKHETVARPAFEHELLNTVIRPVVATCQLPEQNFNEALISKLSRLDDSYAEPAELVFCRTAGALGMSPYDLSDDRAERVRRLIASMPDEDARLDFASVVLIHEIDEASARISEGISTCKDYNTLSGLSEFTLDLRTRISGLAASSIRPWQKGTTAAKVLRAHLALGSDVSIGGVSKLAGLCGASDFRPYSLASTALRAFQEKISDSPTVLVQEGGTPQSTAFVLARAIGDYLVFQSKKSCVANTYTDRQAVGRAFAAEFMAPAEGVIAMIDEDEQSITQVAEHYQVPLDVIEHQYYNNPHLG